MHFVNVLRYQDKLTAFKSGLKKLKRWVVGQELAESMPEELGLLGLTMNQEAL